MNMRDSLQLWFFRRTHEHERLSKAVNLKESSWKCEYLDFPVPISLLLFIMVSLHPSFMISFPVFSLMFTSWSIFHFLFCSISSLFSDLILSWYIFKFLCWFQFPFPFPDLISFSHPFLLICLFHVPISLTLLLWSPFH